MEGFGSLRAKAILFCTGRSGEEDTVLAVFLLQKGSKKYSRCISVLCYKACSSIVNHGLKFNYVLAIFPSCVFF